MSQEILATVAGETITKEDLDAFLQKLPPNQKIYAENPQMRAYYLDQLVSMRLYAALGKEMKLDETEGFRMIMEDVRRKFWFGAGVYELDAERMAELQRKEARMHQIRLQMESSSSGYKNYHQYNMRRMK